MWVIMLVLVNRFSYGVNEMLKIILGRCSQINLCLLFTQPWKCVFLSIYLTV
jgi:hypothetical protein